MSYRGTPEDIEYREREHHPICAWCDYEWSANGLSVCGLRGVVLPERGSGPNDKGQCDNYAPSLSTRVRQLVRLRPFIARIREGIVSQTPDGRVEYRSEIGQVKVLRID